MFGLLIGGLVVGFLFVVLPLILLKAFFGLVFGLLALPFKLLGGLFKLLGGLIGGAFGLAGGLIGLVVGSVAILAGVVLLPLLPLLFFAGVVWLLVKGASAVAHA